MGRSVDKVQTQLRQLGLGDGCAKAGRRSKCLLTLPLEANNDMKVFDPVLTRVSMTKREYRNSVCRTK